MNTPSQNESDDLPLFEPDTDATYTLDVVADLTGVSSRTILHYQEQGLITPVDDESGAQYFDDDALLTLRRIEHLRTHCEMNEAGLKLMLNLLDEIECLREELRSR